MGGGIDGFAGWRVGQCSPRGWGRGWLTLLSIRRRDQGMLRVLSHVERAVPTESLENVRGNVGWSAYLVKGP